MDYGHNALFRYEVGPDRIIILLSNSLAKDDHGDLVRYRIIDALHADLFAER